MREAWISPQNVFILSIVNWLVPRVSCSTVAAAESVKKDDRPLVLALGASKYQPRSEEANHTTTKEINEEIQIQGRGILTE